MFTRLCRSRGATQPRSKSWKRQLKLALSWWLSGWYLASDRRHGLPGATLSTFAINIGMMLGAYVTHTEGVGLPRMQLAILALGLTSLCVGAVVTERSRAEATLQERTSYLNALIENSPLGILVLDQKGDVELTNPAFQKLFLHDPTGGHIDTVFTDDKITSAASAQVFAGKAFHGTVQRRRKDGKVLDVDLHAVPLIVNGIQRGAFGIYNDISPPRKPPRVRTAPKASFWPT